MRRFAGEKDVEMADERAPTDLTEEDRNGPRPNNPNEANYPTSYLPTVFADAVPTMTHAGGIVKFYYARIDPSFTADKTVKNNVIAQVIMPIEGFAQAVAFFDAQLEGIIREGLIKRETVEAYRESNMAAMNAKHRI